MKNIAPSAWPRIDGCSAELEALRDEIIQDCIHYLEEIVQSHPPYTRAIVKYWSAHNVKSEWRARQWHQRIDQMFPVTDQDEEDGQNKKGHQLVHDLDTYAGQAFLSLFPPK